MRMDICECSSAHSLVWIIMNLQVLVVCKHAASGTFVGSPASMDRSGAKAPPCPQVAGLMRLMRPRLPIAVDRTVRRLTSRYAPDLLYPRRRAFASAPCATPAIEHKLQKQCAQIGRMT